jgi:tRNA pseudouridine55 synthase
MIDQDVTHPSLTSSQINPDQSGIWLVDKPTGMTSHDVVDRVRRLTGIKRVGHTGTLDPLASGLLIILVGRQYTKLQNQFLKQDKEYLVTGQLGVTTDSYDAEGKVTNEASWDEISKISQEQIEDSLTQFRGEISQAVPAFSAVKIKGKKLYELARKDQKIEKLPVREVTIHNLELTDFSIDPKSKTTYFSLKVFSSSGTYIRSLVHDLGQVLKVGATVTKLRRTKIGETSIKSAQTLPQ